METTMIQIKKETAEKLKELKKYPRESYDEVINELVQETQAEILTEKEIDDIKEGLEDLKAGRVYPIEAVAKELGIELSD